MAHAIDSNFDESNIAFGLDELKYIFTHKQNKAVIFEEAGAAAFARDYAEQANKTIAKTLQVFGYRKLQIIANLQHIRFLDVALRLQVNNLFRISATHELVEGIPKTQSYAEVFLIKTDWLSEPELLKYKILRNEVYVPLGPVPLPQVSDFFKLTGVTDSLYKNYLKRKDEYFKDVVIENSATEGPTLSKRELALLQKRNTACMTLVNNLIKDQGLSQRYIATLAEIPRSTLNSWLLDENSPSEPQTEE